MINAYSAVLIGMKNRFEDIKQVTLRKKRYRINLATRLGPEEDPLYGACSNPNHPDRIISYYVGLTGERRLDVFIHEMLHACFWDVGECGIQQAATDMAHALWRMGYRMELDKISEWIEEPEYVNIRNKRYKYDRVAGLKRKTNIYVCAPEQKEKFIKVRISLKGERELCHIIRALLYVCYWDFDEEALDQTSKDISHALWRIGYRRSSGDIEV